MPPKTPDSPKDYNLPAAFPITRSEFYRPEPIGKGTRMIAYPAYAGETVLRAPFKTEAELIRISGLSGRFATQGDEHPISKHTIKEVNRYELLKEHVGQFTVGVLPFQDFDQDGNLRTYSTQRLVNVKGDLTNLHMNMGEFEAPVARRLTQFITAVRGLILEEGLIPDLCGKNNLVVDERGKVKLIDVNNINRLVGPEEWSNAVGDRPLNQLRIMAMNHRAKIEDLLPTDYFDDQGYPMGDMCLNRLRRWELALGTQTRESIASDEIYSRFLADHVREEVYDTIVTTIHRAMV